MPVEEMNIVLSFLGSAEFKYVRPIMALIEKVNNMNYGTLIDNNEGYYKLKKYIKYK